MPGISSDPLTARIRVLSRAAHGGRVLVAAASLALLAGAAIARAGDWPVLESPVDCPLEVGCLIQKYVDGDAGPDIVDYRCGRLSSPAHRGTDFRLPRLADMARGVAVVAAAAGVVTAVRDGMDDVNVNDIDRDTIKGRDAGNVVMIDHGGGWDTAYAHLRKGTVAVAVGETVSAGQRLGEIGMSGAAEFPHVHFGVRLKKTVVDPFVGPAPLRPCGVRGAPLWSAAALAAWPYVPTGLLDAGFAGEVPSAERLRAGVFADIRLSRNAPALAFWVELFGVQPDDIAWARMTAPDGTVLAERTQGFERHLARSFRFIGKHRGGGPWPTGIYRGVFELRRGDTVVVRVDREVEINGR